MGAPNGAGPAEGLGGGPPAAWERRDTWILAGLLLVQAVVMAAAFTPAPHTGGDNAGYLGLAHSLLERGAYLDLYLPGEPAHTKYPPVFPGLLAFAHLLGAKTWVGFKAVAGSSTALAVGFSFLWARNRRGSWFALGVAGLVAISSAVVYYSHWILSDPTFLAFTFLALWALERGEGARSGEDGARSPDDGEDEGGSRDGRGRAWWRREAGPLHPGWLAAGAAAAVLAYFTRSAGVPLLAAIGLWLALGRRWRALAAYVPAAVLPAGLWWLRNRGVSEEGAYLSEFWLVDPYRPELGRAGPTELLARTGENLVGYVTTHVPGGITGLTGPAAGVLGIVLLVLAGWGWLRCVRRRPGVAELFVPLYAGLLLLWPVVWSGDRFALPLFPLLIFYAGVAVAEGLGRWRRDVAVAGLAVGVLVLGGPAVTSWVESVGSARSCWSRARADGPWACTGPRTLEFVAAAGWSGANLPGGSVVISRKPRAFYLMSGTKSEMYPLSRDAGTFLERARELGAGYLVFDYVDGLAGYYLAPVLRSRPEAFCPLRGFGEVGGVGTQLLGVLPGADAGDRPPQEGGQGIRLPPCPEGLLGAEPGPAPDYSSGVVPLFSRNVP